MKTNKQEKIKVNPKSTTISANSGAQNLVISANDTKIPAPRNGVIEKLKREIEILENKPYLDLTLICAKLNLNKADTKIIENTFNLECLDNRLEGFNQGFLSKEKDVLKILDEINGIGLAETIINNIRNQEMNNWKNLIIFWIEELKNKIKSK